MATITDRVPPGKRSLKRGPSADLGPTSKGACLQSTTPPTSAETTAKAVILPDLGPQDQTPSRKRKVEHLYEEGQGQRPQESDESYKRLHTSLKFCAASSTRVTHWVTRGRWPAKDFTPDPNMATISGKRSRTSSSGQRSVSAPVTASDRKSNTDKSAQYRDRRYVLLLESKGSFLAPSPLGVTDESRKLCSTLLADDQPIPKETRFDTDVFEQSCANTQNKNEARVIKEIGLLITPSVEDLALRDAKYRYMIESFNEAWTSAIPFEGTRPQPDYSVGLRKSSFTQDQLVKLGCQMGLKTYGTATLEILFPFFTVEVKSGAAGIVVADRQNAHSATVAVKGIVELYRTVRRENELHRNILAFSVSHDQQGVRIYGHYPTIESETVRYYRHVIKIFDIVSEDGKDRWTAYRFVRNVYESFAPDHRNRIMSAVDQLTDPTALTVTPSAGRSNASTSGNVIVNTPPSLDADGFVIPSLPASVTAAQSATEEMRKVNDETQRQNNELRRQNEDAKSQYKQVLEKSGQLQEKSDQLQEKNDQLQKEMDKLREDSRWQFQQLMNLLQQRDRTSAIEPDITS